MNNIITHVQENLDTFDVRPFCDVDSLILSSAAYIRFPEEIPEISNWKGMRLFELYRAEYFNEMFRHVILQENTKNLFFAMAASPRYRNIRVMGFTEQFDTENEMQFSAVSFQITPELCYIAFRGTDASLIGWKEDFNMAFQSPIPSQIEAVRYIERASVYCSGVIYTGGHSKGGNLAVYAAAMCRDTVRQRIDRIFSHDGPGFLEETLQSREFQQITPLIKKTLPQSSIVGMLLENQEEFRIVKSNKMGLLQHDQFSWMVENNDFVYIENLTKDARFADKTLTDWLNQISARDRERFVDALFSVLNANELTTLEDLRSDWQAALPASIHAASQLDGDTKKFLLHTLKELAALGIKNFPLLGKSTKKTAD